MRRAAAAALAVLAFPAPAGAGVTVEPRSVFFGDPLLVRVDVAGAESVQVSVGEPFTALDAPRVERDDGVVAVTQRVACLAEGCLTGEVVLRPVVRADGRRIDAGAVVVRIRSRVTADTVEAREPPFRRTTAPPAPELGFGPRPLFAASALLALAAAVLVAAELRRARRLRPVDPVRRAVRLLRQSAARPPDDRRRAAGLLARVLDQRGADELARRSAALAWSRRRPEPADADALASDAEQLAGR